MNKSLWFGSFLVALSVFIGIIAVSEGLSQETPRTLVSIPAAFIYGIYFLWRGLKTRAKNKRLACEKSDKEVDGSQK